MKKSIVIATVLIVQLAVTARVKGDERLGLPDSAEQASAEKEVRDVFGADYLKRSAEDRLSLARRMLSQANDAANPPSTRFVLLREARDLFAMSGDIDGAVQASDEIIRLFRADEVEIKLPMLSSAVRTAKDPASVAEVALSLATAAAKLGKFPDALKAIAIARTAAAKVTDKSLQSRIKFAAADIEYLQEESKEWSAAKAVLLEHPDDPAANLTAGAYRCFRLDQWADGLPLLRKGSSNDLAAIAKLELAQPANADDMMAIGDAWWAHAQNPTAPSHKRPAELRACYWFDRALPKLTGLKKATVEKRLASVAPQDGPSAADLEAFSKKAIAKYGLPPAIDWSMYRDKIIEASDVTWSGGVLQFNSANGRLIMHRSPPQEASMTFALFLTSEFHPGHVASNAHSPGGFPSFGVSINEKRQVFISVCCGWTELVSKVPIPMSRWTLVTVAWGAKGSSIVVAENMVSQKNRCTPEGGPEEFFGLGKIYGPQTNDSVTGARFRFLGFDIPVEVRQRFQLDAKPK